MNDDLSTNRLAIVNNSRSFFLKKEVARACGVGLDTLRKEIAPLVAQGLIKWNHRSSEGKNGGRKVIHRSEALKILQFLDEGIIPEKAG